MRADLCDERRFRRCIITSVRSHTWIGLSPAFLTSTAHRFLPTLNLIFSFLQITAPARYPFGVSGIGNCSSAGIGKKDPYRAFSTEIVRGSGKRERTYGLPSRNRRDHEQILRMFSNHQRRVPGIINSPTRPGCQLKLADCL